MLRISSTITLLILALAVSGCTPDDYRRSADDQVYSLLDERKKGVLDYTPDSTLAPDQLTADKPSEVILKRIPVTTLPPPQISGLVGAEHRLPFAALGPDPQALSPATSPADDDPYGLKTRSSNSEGSYVYGPPPPLDEQQRLDLFGALRYAMKHSRDYQSQVEEVYLSALDVTLQRHLFEPRFFARTGLKYTGGRDRTQDAEYGSALAVTNTVGVRQQLPYGGEVVAQALVDFVDTLHDQAQDGENAALVLSGSIPLLRGAGWTNLEPLIASERELIYQIREFETNRRELLLQITRSYFNLLTSQRGMLNRQLNLMNLQDLTRRSQALFEAGRMSFNQVQRAQQSQLRAERLLVSSQNTYRSRMDEFKLLIGMSIDELLEIVPVDAQIIPPDVTTDEVLNIASRFRLDLQTARDRMDDAHRRVLVAENGLLPDLNLTAEARMSNQESTPARDLTSQATLYSAGIGFDLPLDRLSERNAYRRALIDLQRTQRAFEQLRQRIGIDARNALRAIHAAELQTRIAESRIQLARRQLDYASELLKEGQGDTRDLVDAQSSLLEAQDDWNDAQASLQISVLDYLRQTGTLRLDPSIGLLGQAMTR